MKVSHSLTKTDLEQILISFYNNLGFVGVDVNMSKDEIVVSFEDDIEEFINN